jgi:hypothetical protein
MPDEQILEDSTVKKQPGLRPLYSVLLTNKRAIFRFDSLGSTLTQSFLYDEIEAINPQKRLLVSYLNVTTKNKSYLINAPDAAYWSKKIVDAKDTHQNKAEISKEDSPRIDKKRELLDMLSVLKENAIVSEKEFQEKKDQIDSMDL